MTIAPLRLEGPQSYGELFAHSACYSIGLVVPLIVICARCGWN